ncbi:single-stranded-DNA-specific exonuclease RecJ [candidate division CPR3 bacterium 4484_211]|uniref:Single-stranded-DNA-specific exonuclease RecJ n=1 Tax=candidate division CPR3 bacterium 4484_211 TaxID=1968527 RepID=A0A1W9NYC8_UNCC3|nr:MAG: single-stranded-DNA-specific exonuclease RecJ [candidate division CPR3 bacterium 4484_211]
MKWKLLNNTETANLAPRDLVDLLLENRGIAAADRERFLNPQLDLEDICSLLPDEELVKARELIYRAIEHNRPVIIHGDYDVDGLCASAVLWEAIYRGLGYPLARPFIPHRINHGYGLSVPSLEEVGKISRQLSSQPPLLITVDCGISAVSEVKQAKREGYEVILTDHHVPGNIRPAADVILHTSKLSGTGVAWVLAHFLLEDKLEQEAYLDLVALATIADLVPLIGPNRPLVKSGLAALSSTPRVGLQELFQKAGIKDKVLTSYHVGWIIGPRLNAAGRIDHALEGLRLLATRDRVQAGKLADFLERRNRQRQLLTDKAFRQALEMTDRINQPLPVLAHPQWHEGVIGLVAAKIMQRFGRPAIAIARGAEISKGSARSPDNFNLIELFQHLKKTVKSFGGHPRAAGFSLASDKISLFAQEIQEVVKDKFNLKSAEPELKIDLGLNAAFLTLDLVRLLEKLSPFGIGNPRPVFSTPKLRAFGVKKVGDRGQHLKLQLQNGLTGQLFSAIGFNLGDLAYQLNEGAVVDVAYQVEEDNYYQKPRLQLKIKDIKVSTA